MLHISQGILYSVQTFVLSLVCSVSTVGLYTRKSNVKNHLEPWIVLFPFKTKILNRFKITNNRLFPKDSFQNLGSETCLAPSFVNFVNFKAQPTLSILICFISSHQAPSFFLSFYINNSNSLSSCLSEHPFQCISAYYLSFLLFIF